MTLVLSISAGWCLSNYLQHWLQGFGEVSDIDCIEISGYGLICSKIVLPHILAGRSTLSVSVSITRSASLKIFSGLVSWYFIPSMFQLMRVRGAKMGALSVTLSAVVTRLLCRIWKIEMTDGYYGRLAKNRYIDWPKMYRSTQNVETHNIGVKCRFFSYRIVIMKFDIFRSDAFFKKFRYLFFLIDYNGRYLNISTISNSKNVISLFKWDNVS